MKQQLDVGCDIFTNHGVALFCISEPSQPALVEAQAEVQHWIDTAVEVGQAFRQSKAHFDCLALTVKHHGQPEAVVGCPTQEEGNNQDNEHP